MRETIQTLLNELTNIDTGTEVTDDLLEENITYFSFLLNETQINNDFDNNYTNQINIIGYVKRLQKSSENTQYIVDKATDMIINKLKELNIRCSSEDVSIENGVIKTRITGKGLYNEINNKLI